MDMQVLKNNSGLSVSFVWTILARIVWNFLLQTTMKDTNSNLCTRYPSPNLLRVPSKVAIINQCIDKLKIPYSRKIKKIKIVYNIDGDHDDVRDGGDGHDGDGAHDGGGVHGDGGHDAHDDDVLTLWRVHQVHVGEQQSW
ncbi:hypothetical protein NPIL_587181 [Nephila pilipes]|uniref:Uncharacterized protein n=1 Tax=Nephila pilipes TaxID=299642 RepID=A0A8X6TI78_NEPPI|nr:hypothetical protein NPIL_587181 [Nephila pilipes]